MSIALRELLRRPGRFTPVVTAMSLLVLLLVVLGGFLDGLSLDQTGAIRAQGDRVLVLSADAELQLPRSALAPGTREAVTSIDGVAGVGVFSQVATTASVAGGGDPDTGAVATRDVVVVGYGAETGVLPAPPPPGSAVVDRRLADLVAVDVGDTLEVGPEALRLRIAGFVEDVTAGAPTLWVEPGTWRDVLTDAAPTSPLNAGGVQSWVAMPDDGMTPEVLADRIDGVAGLEAATVDELIAADPVVSQQSATFAGIIGVTFVVTLLVVGLFFVLITLERVRLYAVLKALGGRTPDLLAGLAVQAVVVALAALVIGGVASQLFALVLPPDLPVRFLPARFAVLAAGTVVTALLGALATLRRLLAVDPAEAIG